MRNILKKHNIATRAEHQKFYGKPRKPPTRKAKAEAIKHYQAGGVTMAEAAQRFGLAVSTFRISLVEAGVEIIKYPRKDTAEYEPTPEEITQKCREIRAANYVPSRDTLPSKYEVPTVSLDDIDWRGVA